MGGHSSVPKATSITSLDVEMKPAVRSPGPVSGILLYRRRCRFGTQDLFP